MGYVASLEGSYSNHKKILEVPTVDQHLRVQTPTIPCQVTAMVLLDTARALAGVLPKPLSKEATKRTSEHWILRVLKVIFDHTKYCWLLPDVFFFIRSGEKNRPPFADLELHGQLVGFATAISIL